MIFFQMPSDKDNNAGASSSKETETERKLKRQIEELKQENIKLENESKKQKTSLGFEDFLLEGESFSNSAKRRLKFQHKRNPYKIIATIKSIVKDAKPFLSNDIINTMNEISGNSWPNGIIACLDFNTGGCTQSFHHVIQKRNNQEMQALHICCFCLELFNIAVYHTGLDCNTLRNIDQIRNQKISMQNENELSSGMQKI